MSEGRAEPVWFGPSEAPLFGLLNMPEGPVRAAVVLCPPLGREYTNSYSTFAELAARLALNGLAVLRFDYRSTGDSFDRVGASEDGPGFVRDVSLAVELVRSLGASRLALVGMRIGGNFARQYCTSEPVDALVLWDPCPNGRTFLREQRLLALLASVDGASPDALDLPGLELTAEMAEEIGAVDRTTDSRGSGGNLAGDVLLLTRLGREDGPSATFDLGRAQHMEVPGQPELLDVQSPDQVVPSEGIETVATWLDKVMPRDALPVSLPAAGEVTVVSSQSSRFGGGPDGEPVAVRERAVRLGPLGLFGIETEPAVIAGSGPTCVFFSVANEHRIGPGRLWVGLSRSLAGAGLRSVRVDVNGFGDSPSRDGQGLPPVHSVLAIDDVLESARAVSPDDPGNVVLFGLCSSGYQILEAALSLSPQGVCPLNPALVFEPPEMASRGRMDARRRFCLPESGLVNAASEKQPIQWVKRRFPKLLSSVRRDLRIVGWRLRSAFGLLQNRPGERIQELAESGTDVLLICGPSEIKPFIETGLRAERTGRPGTRLKVEVLPSLQHSLLSRSDRDEVAKMIIDHVRSQFQSRGEATEPDMAGRGHRGRAGHPQRG